MIKIISRILPYVVVKNGEYLASINDNSVITCDEIIDAKVETNVRRKNENYYRRYNL